MSADTFRSLRGVLLFAVAVNAVTQFVVQAWLAWSFAKYVWDLPGPLPFAIPFALDVFVINMMIVAYVLRAARLRTRIYVWLVLGAGIAAQVLAAEAYAASVDPAHSKAEWGFAARAASVVPALFLAGSLHTMILVGKWTDRVARTEARARAAEAGRPGYGSWLTRSGRAQRKADRGLRAAQREFDRKVEAGSAPKVERPARRELPTALPPAPSGRGRRGPAPHPDRDVAVKRVLIGGEDAASVARELGLEPRTVQLWVKKARKAGTGSPSVPELAAEIARVQDGATDAPVPKTDETPEDHLQ